MDNRQYVVVYPNLPQYKGLDLYIATFGGVTESLDQARKFDTQETAGAFARTLAAPDNSHGPAEVWAIKVTVAWERVATESQPQGENMPVEIKERDAVEELVKFIREQADIDDIAQMWSDRLGDDVCRVISLDDPETKSDPYLNGERVKEKPPKSVLTDAQKKEYLKHMGNQCPLCKHDAIEAKSHVETDCDTAWQVIRCTNCGAEWNDLYALVDVELVEGPQPDGDD